MFLERLTTFNFRNLSNKNEVEFHAKNIFFIGKNGQGKTNLIEAIYILTKASSFRTRLNDDMIKHNENEAIVSGVFRDREGLTRKVGILIGRKRKAIKLDSKNLTDRAVLFDQFPSVVFSHEDMEIVKGTMDIRRKFFDQTISLCDNLFLSTLRRYFRILKNRNIALKNVQNELLDVFDNQLIAEGIEVQKKRRDFLKDFNVIFSELVSGVSSDLEGIVVEYRPSWKNIENREKLKREMKLKRDREIQLGFTVTGPHKDRFVLKLNGMDFSSFSSTGQARLSSLSMKATQARMIYEIKRKKPILLLDDVLLEMDQERKVNFLRLLPPYSQAFFTFLPDENYLSYSEDNTQFFNVENGCLE